MRLAFASIAIAAVGFGTTTVAADSFSAGVATGWVDPETGIPDFANLNLYGFGATTFPGFSPSPTPAPPPSSTSSSRTRRRSRSPRRWTTSVKACSR